MIRASILPDDVEQLAPLLRQEDVAEVLASHGKTPYDALLDSALLSEEPLTFVLDDVPCAMFGVVRQPACPRHGVIWLLGSPALRVHAKTYLRACKEALPYLARDFDLIYNAVDDRYEAALRWLLWLGFKPVAHWPEFGVERRPFTTMALGITHHG